MLTKIYTIPYTYVLCTAYAALLYHPDTAPVEEKTNTAQLGNNKARHFEFIRISEAYGILSKPESKVYYDRVRSRHLGYKIGQELLNHSSSLASLGDHQNISDAFQTQRDNYAAVVSKKASSNWMDLKEKYKTEKWQNMSLSARKVHKRGK